MPRVQVSEWLVRYRLEFSEGRQGRQMRLLGGDGEWMSEATFKNRIAQAVTATEDCLGTQEPYEGLFTPLLSKLVDHDNPFEVVIASVDETEAWYTSYRRRENRELIRGKYDLDATLKLLVYSAVGYYPGTGSGGAAVAWTSARMRANSDSLIYRSDQSRRTKPIPTSRDSFCADLVASIEEFADEEALRWYNDIVGAN